MRGGGRLVVVIFMRYCGCFHWDTVQLEESDVFSLDWAKICAGLLLESFLKGNNRVFKAELFVISQ